MTDSFRAEVLKNLGINLKKIRIEKGLTTADVALHCDLSLNSINEIEKGNKVSLTKFKKLLSFYNKKFEVVIKDK
ncbi:MAG: helix-turn-helix transcriptional regulator [Alphaproteobacteria bacterium]|nr:helix-turn-helix transcriptional regulator [Alphaproteobacteria bacterium]